MEEIALVVELDDLEASIVGRLWQQRPVPNDRSVLWVIHWYASPNDDSRLLSLGIAEVLVMRLTTLRRSLRGAGD
jgi:hypothetical protein